MERKKYTMKEFLCLSGTGQIFDEPALRCYSAINTRTSASLLYGTHPSSSGQTRPKMKSPRRAFRPSPGVASPIDNSLSLAL